MNTSTSWLTNLRVAVVGASVGGLSVANVVHQLGVYVQVYERSPKGFQDRGGAISAIDLVLLEKICGGVNKQMQADMNILSKNIIQQRGHFYGTLWSCLYNALPEDTVHFESEMEQIFVVPNAPLKLAVGEHCLEFDIIIGADGGRSTTRPYVTRKLPAYAGYTLYRGLCDVQYTQGPPCGDEQVNGVDYVTLGYPIIAGKSELLSCELYMGMPEESVHGPSLNRQVTDEADDFADSSLESNPVANIPTNHGEVHSFNESFIKEEKAIGKHAYAIRRRAVPNWFIPFIYQVFGEETAFFWSQCAKYGKVTPHTVWEFVADRVVNGRVILLGDAAHLASPTTSAGAYTAMVDAYVLGQALEQSEDIDTALEVYNEDCVARGVKLYQASRAKGSRFAPDGWDPVSPETLVNWEEQG
ncbi:hypothetical protein SARC_10509 [Sphaeroforma arctica JP610]|uniref:FAD-binding domain-containing protein n=1 Tax=Sphaeroforma arctica JP610 TaxID=667725 RepID=A0A0L0FJR1_9EUKA|nr:hypothetical protein SARC_10509 [Sphaeroforma arctica JP610]KNC77017.1 hypothetical protein SARC_10509 [Sphaeroforma arctica JP610]|eukprot:XP_014150919.1 hypothetical protein SARC_10509 [Sphaeroforma arctica JP610]